MPIRMQASGFDWELSAGAVPSRPGEAMAFRDAIHAAQTLWMLWGAEKDFTRLRGFLRSEARWPDVSRYDNVGLLHRLAQCVHAGGVQVRSVAVVRASPALASAPVAKPEAEAESWTEADPAPEPAEPEERFAVSHQDAQALAEENREFAESGTPFKEMCLNQDNCAVCNAGQSVMAA